ncbi:MAG: YlzJ-like family protein [Desulfurispora sp.]|uniref:YlzJ-like family protein n=1 Tax=Desulfurispora sp. TaxID=3014275 RepID=UPI00404B1352
MILYTPMQLELVLQGLEDMAAPQLKEVTVDGVLLLAEVTAPGRARVARLLSTDPRHYLQDNLLPGREIPL